MTLDILQASQSAITSPRWAGTSDYSAPRPPSSEPIEAVWEVTEHGYVYIEMRPDHAGRAKHTIFVADLAAVVAQIAGRGLDPVERHTYDNGVQKATYRDPTATRFGFGVAPTMTRLETPS